MSSLFNLNSRGETWSFLTFFEEQGHNIRWPLLSGNAEWCHVISCLCCYFSPTVKLRRGKVWLWWELRLLLSYAPSYSIFQKLLLISAKWSDLGKSLQVRHMQAKRKKFFKLSLKVCLTQILVLFGVERPLENKVSVPRAKYKVHALSIMAPSVTKIVSSALVDVSQWMLILPAFGKFLGRFGVPNERHYAEECIFRVLQR